jgi:hypothetical protein
MEGLADITADALAALHGALRFVLIFARGPERWNARRFRFARRSIDQYEYG